MDPLVGQIVGFLSEIGLDVRYGPVAAATVLPGIDVENGAIVVDLDRLRYPGDLLHEAGHLAVAAPERRVSFHHNVGADPAEEMMAIAWSYAAALHIGIDPAIVFHKDGYRGGSESILDAFTDKRYFGVPMLDYVGLTVDPLRAKREGLTPYPLMLRWLRTR